jgi:hypothetical protein
MLKTMVIEPVRAFNGLDVLVARDEGLFAAEGLDLQFARPQPNDLRREGGIQFERARRHAGGGGLAFSADDAL